MKKLFWIVLAWGFFAPFSTVYGQASLNFSSTASDLIVCGASDTFTLTLNNFSSDTLTGVQIQVELPPGISYVGSSLNGVGMSEFNVSVPDSVVFSGPDLLPFQVVSLDFQAAASCGATDTLTLNNQIYVTHSNGIDSTLSAPFNLIFPALSIQQISPAAYQGVVGDTFTRCMTVVNGGFGPVDSFLVMIEGSGISLEYSNFILSSNGSPLAFTQTGDSFYIRLDSSHFLTLGNNDTFFDQNEFLELCYQVVILDCDGLVSQNHEVSWGCNSEVCQATSRLADVSVPVAVPSIVYRDFFYQTHCYDNQTASVLKIVVENNGSGPARDLEIDIAMGGSSTVTGNGYLSRWDTLVVWKNASGGLDTLTPILTELNTNGTANACLSPGPSLRRVMVRIPFVQPGERDTLILNQYSCCKTWCATSPLVAWRSNFRSNYYDQCRVQQYDLVINNIVGSNYGRVLAITPSGPTDVTAGDTALYCLEHSNFRFFNIAAGGYAEAEFILPPTLNYTGLPGDLWYEDVQGDVWNPSSVTQIGDTLRARFDLPKPGNVSLEKVNLKIRLVPDCSGGPCSSGPVDLQYRMYQVPDSNCACRATLVCKTIPIYVHCGICPASCTDGGLIFLDFDSQRWNYGQPDNNEDGLPDVSGALDMNRVRTKYLMYGDTLYTRYLGLVDTANGNLFWESGQAVSTLSRANVLSPAGASIRIYDASSGNSFTCPLAAPVETGTGAPRTFTYDFDTSLACLPPGYLFEVGDSIEIVAFYEFDTYLGSATINCNITNDFTLSNSNTSVTAGCDSYGGDYVLVGFYYVSSGLGEYTVSGCNPVTLSENYYLSVGVCCSNYAGGNMFRYEYRPWAYLDRLQVIIPPGYTFANPTLNFRRTAGTQATFLHTAPALVPLAVNGDTVVFDTAPLWDVNGGTFPLGDDGYYGTFQMQVTPSCEVQGERKDYARYLWDFAPLPQIASYTNLRRIGRDSLSYNPPEINLDANTPSVPGLDSLVTWQFRVENNSNSSASANTWLALISPSGLILPAEVFDLTNGAPLTPVNGIYQLGTLQSDSSLNIRVRANYQNCNRDSLIILSGWDCNAYPLNVGSLICTPDSLTLYLEPQPAEIQAQLVLPPGPYDMCDSIPVEILVSNVLLPKIADMRVSLRLPANGGLEFVSGTGELAYPQAGGFASVADPTGAGNVRVWNLDNISALLASDNLAGISNPDSNSFTLRFFLQTNCNFVSGDRFFVRVRGTEICGANLEPLILASPSVDLNGANTSYTTSLTATAQTLGSCPDQREIRISLVNAGLGNTGSEDSLFVDLPAGFSYIGNFNGINNPPAHAVPNISGGSGPSRLAWNLFTGLTPGDSLVFSFEIGVDPTRLCGPEIINIQSVVNNNLFCATSSSFCNSAVQTGSFILNQSISRPDLDLLGFTSSLQPISGGYDYNYSATLSNNGLPVLPGTPMVVSIYCDSDLSGGYTAGDNLLGSFSNSGGLANGANLPISGNFFVPNTACHDTNLIYALVLPDTLNGLCLCDSAFANTNAVLPVSWLSVNGKAEEWGNRVYWKAQTDGSHAWFSVERKNGTQWEAISDKIYDLRSEYQFLDGSCGLKEWYRIRQSDQNGDEKVSPRIEILREREVAGFAVWPNPAKDLVHIQGPEAATVELRDARGKVFAAYEMPLTGELSINSVNLSAGIYFIRVKTGASYWSEKLIIQR